MQTKLMFRVVALGLALSPALAGACSESMFRAQMGLRHYAAAHQQPARILVVEGKADAVTRERERVYGSLRRAGHEVVPVADASEARAALGGSAWDLVVAAPSEAEQALAGIDDAGDASALLPRVVPVLVDGGGGCALCIHQGDSAREILRIVARALHSGR